MHLVKGLSEPSFLQFLIEKGKQWEKAVGYRAGTVRDPLNGSSVGFRFGLTEGWIVKLFGPFEVEVLRIAFQLNEDRK